MTFPHYLRSPKINNMFLKKIGHCSSESNEMTIGGRLDIDWVQ